MHFQAISQKKIKIQRIKTDHTFSHMALPYFYQVIAGIFRVIFSWKEMSIIPTIIRRNIIN